VSLTVRETDGGFPDVGEARFDVIVAMDCLEHIPMWRDTLAQLVAHLKPGGVLFANNAVLDDTTHPEHYDLKPGDFLKACADLGLVVQNSITYVKRLEAQRAA